MISHELNRRGIFAGTAGAVAFAAFPALARKPKAPAIVTGDWGAARAMLADYVAEKKIPGGAGAVGRGTDAAAFLVSGTLARDNPRLIDADSLFRIYSMTKPITGIAAMMLVEDGKIGLDQNIADFIPGFKNPMVLVDPAKDLTARPATGPITIRNLLTHTAGLGYTIVTKGPLLDEYIRLGLAPGQISKKTLPGLKPVKLAPSLEEFANRLATLPLIADPASKWSYSVGLDLIGRIIEIASGMPFDAFLKTRIFDPLGMASTWFQVPTSELPRLTTNYGVSIFGKIPIDAPDDSIYAEKPAFPFGGAGLVSSPRDYDRFLQMLAGYGAIGKTRLIKTETAKLAMSNLMPATADTKGTLIDGQGFGAGGRVTLKPAEGVGAGGGAGVGTFGWGGAAATIAWVDPVRQIRAAGYAQFMPDQSMPFTKDFGKAVYAGVM
jgi:CubicO group peptidase (beta-lactamase class C family)